MTGADALAAARAWIGTPFRHQAALKGVGCDCLGLVVGVLREGGRIIPPPPAYAAAGRSAIDGARLLEGLDQVLRRVDRQDPVAGDILTFRWRQEWPVSHLAIANGEGGIIHAHAGAMVAEVALTAGLRRRLAFIHEL